jgi:chromosome segregation ATPase
MDGDAKYLELLQGQARIEAQLARFSEDMKLICAFRDELLATRQEFNDYKEGRKDLPEKITMLEGRASLLETNYNNLKLLAESTSSEVSTLKKWANQASGIQIGLSALILIVAAIGPILDWWLR